MEGSHERPLPIRTRHTLGADGSVSRLQMVFCPGRERTITLVDCGTCDHCGRRGANGEVVTCHWPPEPVGETGVVGASADTTPLPAIMAGDVYCVRADVRPEQLRQLLIERKIGGAPVVDGEGRLEGMVSKTDLIAADGEDVASISAFVSGVIFSLPESATVSQASALMAYEGVHRLPVISLERHVVGIISAIDVLGWLARASGFVLPERG